ncbi:MAG: MFS transporter [Acidobacteria bacterium]|nr:MFS transporter [Acidobacteriota bacterium]MBI3427279.1 MFS transporter [Acidobacteriota bacterium]
METTAQAAPAQLSFREVLQLPPVRRLWLAQIVSIFGDFLALFAVLSVVSFKLHGSALQVTLISVAFMIPFAFVGPLAGVFVDRWNVKRTMIASDLIRSGLALCLVFAHSLTQLYLILFALSFVSTFFVPAQTITLRTIVPQNGLMAANALMQQAFQLVRIVSPALAGLMVERLGAQSCYYVDFVSFLFSASMIASLVIAREAKQPDPNSHPLKSLLDDLMAGIKFCFTHETLAFVILAMSAAMFAISCFGPLIAIYVRDDLHANSTAFGIINALIGVGMIFGTLNMNRVPVRVSKSQLILLGLLTMGAFVLLLAAWRSLIGAGVGMFGIGLGVVFVFVSAQTLMQGQTPMEMMGRVSGSLMAALSWAQLIGLAISGSLAHATGVRALFFASAVMLAAFAGIGYFRLPNNAVTTGPSPTVS